MNIEQIREALPDYARDLKLNLGTVLTPSGAPGLNEKQIWSIALASRVTWNRRRRRTWPTSRSTAPRPPRPSWP
jgi:alkyl hydroperoxide reductase subunit D